MPHYSPVALIQGIKLKFPEGNEVLGYQCLSMKGIHQCRQKGLQGFYTLPPFPPWKGVQIALKQYNWPKGGLPGIHTMMSENLESTNFLPV